MITPAAVVVVFLLIMTPIINAGTLAENAQEGMEDTAVQVGGAALGTKSGIEKAFKGDIGGSIKSYTNAGKSLIGAGTSFVSIPFKKD